MPEILTIREAARRLGVRPRDLHDRFYDGRLGDDCCRYVGTRRVILDSQLDRIKTALPRHLTAAVPSLAK
jgi:hypothetical protein